MGIPWKLFKTVDSPLLKQSWTMSAVLISMVAQGILMTLTFESGIMYSSTSVNIMFWLMPVICIARILGILSSSLLMDVCGRRIAYVVLLLPAVVGRLCIYFASTCNYVNLIGVFFCWFTFDASFHLGNIIIGEYTCPKYRAIFIALKYTSGYLGMMLAKILMPFISWRTQALVSITPVVICFGIILTWPESPYWLLTKQRFEKCESSFYYLRGQSIESRRELEVTIQQQRMSMQPQNISCFDKFGNFIEKFGHKSFLKPLFVMMLAAISLTASGKNCFLFYTSLVMSSHTGQSLDSNYYSLAIGVIVTVSAVIGSLIIGLVKRRPLLLFTGLATFIILLSTSLYTALVSNDIISGDISAIPWVLFSFHSMLSSIGCWIIPMVLDGEIFPLAHKSTGLALSSFWLWLCMLVEVRYLPHFFDKVHWLFAISGVILGMSLVVLYFVMPETKDKTLQEIENYFKYGKYDAPCDKDDEENVEIISLSR